MLVPFQVQPTPDGQSERRGGKSKLSFLVEVVLALREGNLVFWELRPPKRYTPGATWSKSRAPPATETWFPLSHSQVLGSVVQTLDAAGFGVQSMSLAVTPDDARFFGTLQLKAEILPGVGLAVGVRNSIDRSLPIGFCCGQWVLVCDNLGFSSEVVITRKHTRFGESRFNEAIASAVAGLGQYRDAEAKRIELLRTTELSGDRANSLILQAFEGGIIGARLLPDVIQQWRQPKHPEFQERTAWSLLNAFTEVLKDRQQRQPSRAAHETITLQKLSAAAMASLCKPLE